MKGLSCVQRRLNPKSFRNKAETFAAVVMPIPTLRPTSTLALLRQRLYPTSEVPLKLSLVHYNLTTLRVVHKPITTLRQLLTNVKDKDKPEDRQGAVYKIKCCDCQANYIGETGRNLSTRRTEHKRPDAQVVETSVTINNSPFQDYVHPGGSCST